MYISVYLLIATSEGDTPVATVAEIYIYTNMYICVYNEYVHMYIFVCIRLFIDLLSAISECDTSAAAVAQIYI